MKANSDPFPVFVFPTYLFIALNLAQNYRTLLFLVRMVLMQEANQRPDQGGAADIVAAQSPVGVGVDQPGFSQRGYVLR